MRTLVLLTTHLLLLVGLASAQTPAGSIVRSQAVATVNGERYLSNAVDTVVQAVCGVSITPNGTSGAPAHRVGVLPGSPAYLPFIISNTGNAPQVHELSVRQDPSSDWTPTGRAFYLDANRNARVDSNEPAVTSVTLERGTNRHLVLQVDTPVAETGSAILAPVAACTADATDDDNISVVTLDAPASLLLEKSASPARAEVGTTVEFRLAVTNGGAGTITSPVVLTDLFDTPDLEGVAYLAGSASTSLGTVEYFDGIAWTAAEPASVEGLRVRVDGLDQDQRVLVTFRARVDPAAVPGLRSNTLTAEAEGYTSSTRYPFEILPVLVHDFGPSGNPAALPGGEGTEDDEQYLPHLTAGQSTCTDLTLRNAGTHPDRYHLGVAGSPEGIHAEFRTPYGAPLDSPLALRAGEEITLQHCLTPSGGHTEPFTLTLSATSEQQGRTNRTRITVAGVHASAGIEPVLSATPTAALSPGGTLTYELVATNRGATPLTNAQLSIPVPTLQGDDPPALELVSASHEGHHDAGMGTVAWAVPDLEPGQAVKRTLTVRAPPTSPDGRIYTLATAFTFRSTELPNPVSSNTVTHAFPGHQLLAGLTITPNHPRLGGHARFTFTLSNPTSYPVVVDVQNVLPHGVTYEPGTAHATIGGVDHAVEPTLHDAQLTWELAGVAGATLGPAGSATDQLVITYRGLITPQATPVLLATGTASGRATLATGTVAIASNQAIAEAHLAPDLFTDPPDLLTGRVYLDRNLDRAFDAGLDTPLENTRLVLSNGWQVTTDTNGLYAFRNLRRGPWLVLLDPSSAPFPAAGGPQRLVHVQGVTVQDFPLEAPTGILAATRSTTLSYGPITLAKSATLLPDRTTVTLTLHSSRPLDDVTVRDPLPDGGTREFHVDHLEGRRVFTYDLPADAPLTDPDVRWRDPYR